MARNFYCKIFVFIWCISHGNSVPIDYCLLPFNRNDCNGKPTPVFSYYKPGSRCEIEIWRGCPTFNKFPDEVLCSHHCIAKIIGAGEDKNLMLPIGPIEEPIEERIVTNQCLVPINQADCGLTNQTFKYTFIDMKCKKVPWKGCESPNAFDTEEECKTACTNWSDKVESLPIEDVNAIAKILEVVDKPEEQKIHQMMLIVTTNVPVTTTTTAKTTTKMSTKTTTKMSTKSTTEVDTTTKPIETTTEAEIVTEAETTEAKVQECSTVTESTSTTITTITPDESDGDADEVITT